MNRRSFFANVLCLVASAGAVGIGLLPGCAVDSHQPMVIADSGVELDALLDRLKNDAILWYRDYALLHGDERIV